MDLLSPQNAKDRSVGPVTMESGVATGQIDRRLTHAVVRQIFLGLQESLTIAGQLGTPVQLVNWALVRLRDDCDGCLSLHQPYAGEPRFTVVVEDREALKRAGWT